MTTRSKQDHCCDCIPTQNRCNTDICSCFAAGRICDEHCESVKFRLDCLNQAICKCSCEAPPETHGTGGVHNSSGPSVASGNAAGVASASSKKPLCNKADKCECLRLREGCNRLCACRQICKNKEVKKPQKAPKPKLGCNCSKNKRQCLKKDCPCRNSMDFCGAQCKCSADCTNSQAKFHVPKHVQNCFLEHKNESSGLILTLVGDDYFYRTEFYHDSKNEPHVEEQLIATMYELISKYNIDLYEIIIYVSKSPCFHQDCEPKCEVIDECKSNKACSKLLTLLLSKVRKELGKVDVKMSVKFLFPHLHRGDLYTKQGLLCMLQNGISVEPLLMKDWSAIMDWCPHSENKGEYLKLWNDHQLDKAVAQSQSFVNECRRAMGLSMKFWVAEIHEIVKNTILNYTDIRNKLQDLTEGLKSLDLTATPSKIRSTPSKRRSFLDILELRDRIQGKESNKALKDGSNPSLVDDSQAQQMVASFCGRSFDDTETNEIAQRIRRATANINLEIESLMEFLHQKGN